jgi:hypothetical protein
VAVIFALGFFYSSFNSVAGLQTKKSLLVLHDEQDVYLLGNYLEYLEDPSQTLNIQQISSPPYSEKFISGDAEGCRLARQPIPALRAAGSLYSPSFIMVHSARAL